MSDTKARGKSARAISKPLQLRLRLRLRVEPDGGRCAALGRVATSGPYWEHCEELGVALRLQDLRAKAGLIADPLTLMMRVTLFFTC